MAKYYSLFKIYGGASNALNQLIPIIMAMASKHRATEFYDIFGGGAHVAENVPPYNDETGAVHTFDKVIYNDSDEGFCSLLRLCQEYDTVEILIDRILKRFATVTVDKERRDRLLVDFDKQKASGGPMSDIAINDWYFCKQMHDCLDFDEYDRAAMTYVYKTFSYSGGSMVGTVISKDKSIVQNKADSLSNLYKHIEPLENVSVNCGDAFKYLYNAELMADSSKLLFLDPPWLSFKRTCTGEYTCEMAVTRQEAADRRAADAKKQGVEPSDLPDLMYHSHEELRDILLHTKRSNIIMIGYDLQKSYIDKKTNTCKNPFYEGLKLNGFIRIRLDVMNQSHDPKKIEYAWVKGLTVQELRDIDARFFM